MNAWQRWVQRPQGLWVRKALFQVHLWIGIGIGLYILVISVSGSAIVYRRELIQKYGRRPVTVVKSGPRMSHEEVAQRALQLHPGYELEEVVEPQRKDRPYEVILGRGKERMTRWFDEYTGADLGNPRTRVELVLTWFVDLHDNLLGGETGRFVNGIGSILVTIMALSGLVIWWPGRKNWRRSMTINWKAPFVRFNWDLHSAVGFWCSLLVLMWGFTGIYFTFPTFLGEDFADSRFLIWLTRVHFGRFGWKYEVLWTIFGLVPALLFVTGATMWWNRVLRKKVMESEPERIASPAVDVPIQPDLMHES